MTSREDLDRLAELHERGVLSDDEYTAARRRALADLPTGPLVVGRDLPEASPPTDAPETPHRGRVRTAPPRRAARFDYREVLAAAGLVLLLALFYLAAREWRRRDAARDAVRSGDAALLAGDYAGALDAYRAATERWPEVPLRSERLAFAEGGVQEASGLAALAEDDPAASLEFFSRAVARYQAAEAAYPLVEAEADERAALAERIQSTRASEAYALGLLALRDGDVEAAVSNLEQAAEIEARPEIQAALARARARLAFEEGSQLLRDGDVAGAYELFRSATELERLPEYVAALEEAARRIGADARSALSEGVDAVRERNIARSAGAATLYAVHYPAASEACRAGIEAALALPHRWTDTWWERKFPRFQDPPKAPGVLTLTGEALELQGPDGTWRTTAYACDFDTGAGAVTRVEVR